jgi:DNA-binding response OmpR family regulator
MFPTVTVAHARPGRFGALSRRLRSMGRRVFEVTTGRDLVDVFLRWRVDACIVHRALADGDGFTMLPIVRGLSPEVRIIAVSDAAEADLEAQARAAGVVLYALEPVDQRLLFAAVESATRQVVHLRA